MKILITVLLLTCASSSYATEVIVGVESVTSTIKSSGKKVYVVSGSDEIPDSDTLFQKYAKMTYKSLEGRGYVPVYKLKDADLVLLLGYSVKSENLTSTRNVPIFGGNSTTNVHNKAGVQVGSLKTQNFQPTGYRQDVTNFTIYHRSITLHVYEAARANDEDRNKHLIWGMALNSSGPSSELSSVFPHLLVVGAPYFGEALDAQVVKSIDSSDKRALALSK